MRKGSENPKGDIYWIYGWHAVVSAWLNPGRKVKKLYITQNAMHKFSLTLKEAERNSIARPAPQIFEGKILDKTLKDAVHQGIAIQVHPLDEVFLQDLIIQGNQKDKDCLVMLDQITDPHNVGAILRTACAFDVSGLLVQKRHSPRLDGALAKVATGALEHVPVCQLTNLSDCVEALQDNGYTAFALDEHADTVLSALSDSGKNRKILCVLGSEGKGIRPKIKNQCDFTVSIKTSGALKSLNVSNAAAICLHAFMAR